MSTLYNKLEEYAKNDYIPFHMPGHKRNSEKFGLREASFDITEIDGFDDYHYPQGIIREIEEQAAKVYHSDASFYLVNGSTSGILTAVSASVNYGDSVVVARNCHKAVYNAVYLNGLMPEYVYPVVDNETGILGQILPEDVEHALKNTGAKAVVITSPTYEGLLSDVEQIAKVCHENNAVLIVDEAHGAHFNFSEEFPKTAVECGADIVIESLHKTLPAYTQTAILHVKGERADINRIKKYLSIYQTSSPSYVFMAGINRCIDYMTSSQGQADNIEYIEKLKKLRENLKKLKNIKLYPDSNSDNKICYDTDLSKLVLYVKGRGVSLYEELLHQYHIQPEMAAKDYVILMTSIGDCHKWYERLYAVLTEIDARFLQTESATVQNICKAKVVMSPRNALEKEIQKVSRKQCAGRIAAELIYAYPPGIPIFYPGEEITKELLLRMDEMEKAGVMLKGLQDEKGENILCIK